MASISYKEGNVFNSCAQIICHQTNCLGVMGSGVAAEVKKRYPNVFEEYHKAFKENRLAVGTVIFSETGNDKNQIIANMCAQYGVGYGKQQTEYPAVEECLKKVIHFIYEDPAQTEKLQQNAKMCGNNAITVAFPYGIGSVRGGGDWNVVLSLIEKAFEGAYINVEIWKL